MDRTVKGVIATIAIASIIFIAAFGSYIPMRKSQMFIATLQSFSAQPPTSLQDLEGRIAAPLDYYSPIGQEELVRNTANNILGLIQHGVDATTTHTLVTFLSSYYDPIIARGRGMSFGQDLYIEGAVNEIAFAQTGDPSYLSASLKYYSEGHAWGPNRPQTLYGLFDVYRAMGDAPDAAATAQEILKNWPTDARIQASMAQFLSSLKKPTSTKAAK